MLKSPQMLKFSSCSPWTQLPDGQIDVAKVFLLWQDADTNQ